MRLLGAGWRKWDDINVLPGDVKSSLPILVSHLMVLRRKTKMVRGEGQLSAPGTRNLSRGPPEALGRAKMVLMAAGGVKKRGRSFP
jgi:hypothetical protein